MSFLSEPRTKGVKMIDGVSGFTNLPAVRGGLDWVVSFVEAWYCFTNLPAVRGGLEALHPHP